jgi:uncharacterized protein (DUF427 family)
MTEHVRVEPAKRVQIRVDGQPIVDTARGYVVHEGSLPARYYVPRDEVHGEIADGEGGAKCPWKGLWKHLDIVAGGKRIPNAAWTYYETTPVCSPIHNFIAFYPSKVDIDVE